MRYIIIVTLTILITSGNSYGQSINELSVTEFENITINSVPLGSIMKTNGNASQMPKELGKPQYVKKQSDKKVPQSTIVEYDGFIIGFAKQLNAKGNLTRIEFSKSDVKINVSGNEFYLGKDISVDLNTYKINQKMNGEQSLLFKSRSDSDAYLSITFNRNNIVTNIVYFVLT